MRWSYADIFRSKSSSNAIRLKVNWISIKVTHRPLLGAFLIPPALPVVVEHRSMTFKCSSIFSDNASLLIYIIAITFHITSSKKQSEERAALFADRVHVIVISKIIILEQCQERF